MKTITLYELKKDSDFKYDLLAEETLASYEFSPCGELDKRKVGFVPCVTSSTFVDKINTKHHNYTVVCIQEQKKTPEKYLIDEYVSVKEREYLNEVGDEPDKSTLKVWKEEGTDIILKTTYPKQPKQYTVAFRSDGLVLVEAKGKLAEDLLSFVRKVLGTLPVVPKQTETSVTDLMDEMVKTSEKSIFTLGDKVSLEDDEGLSHILSKGSVYSSDAEDYVKDGMFVTSLELEYDGTTTFTLKDDLVMDGFKFDKDFLEEEKDSEAGTMILKLNEIDKVVDEILGRLEDK